ncbi:phosphomannomutase/phosphoglucomutase [Aestuariirhabdus litorea]|uniref:phosphomannomutase n=1 Tax=Aestuariirhabdus litorea TaxID=2528527 RepID=A0A3P3VII0_9GAMM|nr:phosphomannomutase/phosphoglucomutase [Aestuariirhabdus litorea]RRJ82541.1 phosphomannomutase/phosphoglucomutase [Aestuariirhabdus litorea]RWW92702.1 phosphomannomutase/phosphoglucomutase [Endozoicomonadaceae bacterium GTF-13]
MKGFSKKSKESEAAPPQAAGGASHDKKSSNLKYSVVAAGGALLGLLLALALIYLLLVAAGNAQHREEIAQTQLNQAASLVNQQLRRLEAQLAGIAADAELVAAAKAQDNAALDRLEQRFASALPKALQVRVLLKGDNSLDESGPAPMNFSARDMVSKASRGQPGIHPEVHTVGEKQLLLAVAPVREGSKGPLLGAVLVSWDARIASDLLSGFDGALGEVALVQSFDANNARVLARTGNGDASVAPYSRVTSNEWWRIEYRPSAELVSGGPNSAVPLLLALLVALALILVSSFIAHRMFDREVRRETALLITFIQQLLERKPAQSNAFTLEMFHNIALTIGEFFKQSSAHQPRPVSKPAASKTPEEAPSPPMMEVNDDEAPAENDFPDTSDEMAPLFQSTDILDIEDIDQDEDLLLGDDYGVGEGNDVPASIFRAYDIRGVVGDTLQSDTVRLLGMALGSEALAQGESTLVVGFDGRLSSPEISDTLAQGILKTGCNVINIGMVPTPVLYYATHELDSRSGVMVTGSHNPPDYNGFKIVIGGNTLANEQIQALYHRIVSGDFSHGQGEFSQVDLRENYIERIRDDVAIAKPLRVVIDCGNGVAGDIAPRLFEELGCDVVPLFCEVDGNFPNHHPDPGKPANLQDLIARVQAEGADVGIAFDGDGDRVGVVTDQGKIIYPDRLLMMFAKDVVARNPGADIIFDVKCTRRLSSLISGYGGRPVMWKTGHSLIKAKMKETGALLAGEMSGHIFFKERWYGFDDGLYSAARLLEILGVESRSADELFAAFPEGISTPEINIEVTEESKFELVEKLVQMGREGKFGKGSVTDIDGLRIDYPVGWGLVRASNTTPVLVLRFEADSQEALQKLQALFKQQLLTVDSGLNIPF